MAKWRAGWGLESLAAGLSLRRDSPTADEPATPGAWEWRDVRVRHWVVIDPCGIAKGGERLYRCVSRCGVGSLFRKSALAAGATITCEACRPNTPAPPSGRVIEERHLPEWQRGWEEIAMVDEKSNLEGRKATAAWVEHGRPVLLAILDRCGLGRDFGWKAFVRDCHEQAGSRNGATCRVRNFNDAQRRVELSIRPVGGPFTFEVDLATGRTDRPFADVRRRLEAALNPPEPAKPQPANPPGIATVSVASPPLESPVPASPRDTILGGIDLAKLLKMRDGFDTLITVGKDVQTATELKRELETSLAVAEEQARPLRDRHDAAAAVAREAVFAAEEAQVAAEELNRKLVAAVQVRDRTAAECEAAHRALDAALAEYAPARDAVETARRQLAEAEQLEAERLKTLGKADDVLALLAALQKLNA
jgi:hypothetical protein